MPDTGLESALQSIWYRRSAPPLPLRALSRLFALGVRVRRAAYARGWLRSQRLEHPVVVVGNLTVGGSGKTPLVIWLAAQLRAAGLTPGIVLRGYGGSAARTDTPLRVEHDSDASLVGDEALLLRRRTAGPVVVGRDRASAARLLSREGVDVIIADDGLQHLALARDFEIAVIDGERGFGNGHLLPAGPLRESPAQLAHLDAVVINGEGRFWSQLRGALPTAPCDAVPAGAVEPPIRQRTYTMRLLGERLLPLAADGEPLPLSSFAGRRVHAMAGIGDPQRFFAQLRAAGLQPIEHAFPDHHRYRPEELRFEDGLPLLMTEKDAVKCQPFGGSNRWYLPVSAEFEQAEAAALLARLHGALQARDALTGRNRLGRETA